MDPELKFKKINSENTDRQKVKFRKQLLTYLFFLFVSVVFWYLNALSKNYLTQLNYSVNYINYPKGKILISDIPANVQVLVKGNGFHLLRYKVLSFFRPIELDLNEYSSQIEHADNQYKYFLFSKSIRGKINSIFANTQIYGIEPDTLFFNLTEVVEKRIAIVPDLVLEYKRPYMLKGIIHVIPDSMIVSGPSALIDTLKFIRTKKLQIKGIEERIIADVELIPLDRFIFPAKKVKIFIPVEKYTEISYTIPIEAENVPTGYELKTFPTTIKLSFNVAVSDYDKMNAYMFRATVDYSNILASNPQKLKITLSKSSPMAKNIKYNPKSIEYLVERW